jgi:EAL domain-containing protein (putative c-di-GMP-specific phosphodiesterase class I)
LLYQPKVNLADGTIAGFEALLRWHHPKRGLVSPVEFIPVLEQTGLIINVGNWVLHQACLWASRSAAQGMTAKVSVNLSSRQFKQENLLQTIRQTLADNHCQPQWLELELTEGALVDDLDRTRKVLNQLAEMGVSLAIDDFGTGYSSLNYLKWLPFNTLKIDKSFIKHAPQIKQEKAIVMTIAQLASNLGMQVVAEGVETDCQYHMLKDLAQHDLDIQIQGFIFSQPLPEKQLASCIEHVAKRWHEVDCA